jgi:hypothetical protein
MLQRQRGSAGTKIEEAPKDTLCNNFTFDLPHFIRRMHRPPLSSPLPGIPWSLPPVILAIGDTSTTAASTASSTSSDTLAAGLQAMDEEGCSSSLD